MLRILISTFYLTLISQTALAEFNEVTKTGDYTVYTEASSIEKKGNTAKLWVLIDYKEPIRDLTGKTVLSDKLRYQYQCKEKHYSIIATTAHSGHKATGAIVSINPDPPKLTPVAPGSLDETLWKQACVL